MNSLQTYHFIDTYTSRIIDLADMILAAEQLATRAALKGLPDQRFWQNTDE